jgi:anti-anti-sigma factor
MTDLEIERVTDPPGLRLTGELDLATVADVDGALRPLADAGGDITLDLSALRFMDSSAVQLLIRTVQTLAGRGRVHLVKPMNPVRRLIEVMGLNRFENLEIHE